MQNVQEFKNLGLSPKSLEAVSQKGFQQPTEIQARCIPVLLQEHRDLIGQAQTGTGKTAAFALPILEMIDDEANSGNGRKDKSVKALVLVPTRELCMQVCDEIQSLGFNRDVKAAPIYGGASYSVQIRALKEGTDVVVGTPGRILDHIERGTLDLSLLRVCVLDEADEMLDMGFIEDIETILAQTPDTRRMLCFSATMPEPILKLASRFMNDYQLVKVQTVDMTSPLTRQIYYEVREADKFEALRRTIDMADDFYGIVFCRTKLQCDEIGAKLISAGYNAEVLHGDLGQNQRELIIHKMREKRISILVATDVAARGLDIPDMTHVVNFSLPQEPESYIHRVGRTGRAGKNGLAVTFVTPGEFRKFSFIKRIAKTEIAKERVPQVQDILAKRKRLIQDTILDEVAQAESGQIDEDLFNMAKTLCASHHPTNVIAALLKEKLGSELSADKYGEMEDLFEREKKKKGPRGSAEGASDDQGQMQIAGMDDKGFTRLFIAIGRSDGFDKKGLVEFITKKSGVKSKDIHEVEVFDDFSFATTAYFHAQRILDVFSSGKNNKGGAPLVTKARGKAKDGDKPERKSDRVTGRSSSRSERSFDRKPRTKDGDLKVDFKKDDYKPEKKSRKGKANTSRFANFADRFDSEESADREFQDRGPRANYRNKDSKGKTKLERRKRS